MQEACDSGIHVVLKGLIARKSARDRANFTVYQLAKAIDMPNSVLVKLLHQDPAKRVNNPRLDTLIKIIDFFRADGFDVTLDSFLASSSAADLAEIPARLDTGMIVRRVPLYGMAIDCGDKVGAISVSFDREVGDVIGFVSDEFIAPIFKAGSIFIVDTHAVLEDGMLVAAKLTGREKVSIARLSVESHRYILRFFDDEECSPVIPTRGDRVIGVVVQVNAKT